MGPADSNRLQASPGRSQAGHPEAFEEGRLLGMSQAELFQMQREIPGLTAEPHVPQIAEERHGLLVVLGLLG